MRKILVVVAAFVIMMVIGMRVKDHVVSEEKVVATEWVETTDLSDDTTGYLVVYGDDLSSEEIAGAIYNELDLF